MIVKQGSPVELCELLDRKEFRAREQQRLLKRCGQAMISFTINMPGPIKLNEESCFVFEQGIEAIERLCRKEGWTISRREVHYEHTGPEALLVIAGASPSLLKKRMMEIENRHPLGRIMDLDVIDTLGQTISRKAYDLPPRQCMLCEDVAAICVRSHRHSVDELLAQIREMINDYQHRNSSSTVDESMVASK